MGGVSVHNAAQIPTAVGRGFPSPERLLLILLGQEIVLSVRMGEPAPGPQELLVGFAARRSLLEATRCLGIRFRGGRVLGSFDLLHVSPSGRFSASFGRQDGSSGSTFVHGDTVSAVFPAAGLDQPDVGLLHPFTVRDGRLAGVSFPFGRLGG